MKKKRKSAKIGRNDPCPCGSRRKYKKCHGAATTFAPGLSNQQDLNVGLRQKMAELEALQKQREKQQGLGRPIISTLHNDCRFVAVGNRLYYSKEWKTFHDFLPGYLANIFGADWGNAELKKDFHQRHPIVQWYELMCKYQQAAIKEPGKVHSVTGTGAYISYIGLSYNLYLLAHNAEVQEKLITRLKQPNQFAGAHYETYVAAAFIKAGFNIAFENETDGSRSHCEFTATYKETGKKFSVEAKARAPSKTNADVGEQLCKALRKEANHMRVVFIDINVPDDASRGEENVCLREVLDGLRRMETALKIHGEPAPKAYVFVTNHPYQYSLEGSNYRESFLAEGFKITEFKMGASFLSIREALKARDRHVEMFKLMESLRDHYEIPSTFEGEIPEFAFADPRTRLKIGQRYLVPDGQNEVAGILVDAAVVEDEKTVFGVYQLDDGRNITASCPITDDELLAYRRYPDTFFGIYKPNRRKITDPLDMFDFFYETYSHTTRAKLLEFLKAHPQYDKLLYESQEELLVTYCEGLVYSLMSSIKQVP
jgi:hypothetical protein